ncbi:MAG: hypothetical protein HYS52_02080 [Candidatus Wildermuthbacteria bacterium]|nr:hypothetical protein [Candidatus Wildermuthbacteria bacterium]
MNKNIIIGAVALLIIIAAAYYFFVLQKSAPQVTPLEKEQGLGSELYKRTGNPGGVVPETNPFQNVQANPLEGTNPFEGGYKNPFGE